MHMDALRYGTLAFTRLFQDVKDLARPVIEDFDGVVERAAERLKQKARTITLAKAFNFAANAGTMILVKGLAANAATSMDVGQLGTLLVTAAAGAVATGAIAYGSQCVKAWRKDQPRPAFARASIGNTVLSSFKWGLLGGFAGLGIGEVLFNSAAEAATTATATAPDAPELLSPSPYMPVPEAPDLFDSPTADPFLSLSDLEGRPDPFPHIHADQVDSSLPAADSQPSPAPLETPAAEVPPAHDATPPATEVSALPDVAPHTIVVAKGQTLWSIVREQYPDISSNSAILEKCNEIAQFNHIDPSRIVPGQSLTLPGPDDVIPSPAATLSTPVPRPEVPPAPVSVSAPPPDLPPPGATIVSNDPHPLGSHAPLAQVNDSCTVEIPEDNRIAMTCTGEGRETMIVGDTIRLEGPGLKQAVYVAFNGEHIPGAATPGTSMPKGEFLKSRVLPIALNLWEVAKHATAPLVMNSPR